MTTERSLQILLVDDEEIVHQTVGGYLRESGHRVDEAGNSAEALKAMEAGDYDLALVDVLMPGPDGLSLLARIQEIRPEMSVVIITGYGTMETAIRALRLGVADFLTKPVKLLELDAVIEKSVRIRELRQDRRHLREAIRGIQTSGGLSSNCRGLVGESAAIQKAREQVRQVVETGCETVLITGETGTGKEVVAREIHFQAGLEERPFIAVSCPALTDSLIESELFGHVRGAFTGAVASRAGYFEMADGGTLFLDEVADLSPAAQAALLRAIETRAFRPVGGQREVRVNVRVIAATNAPLEERVEAGRFRRDLFYRLNVYTISLPPLRERREDILPLAEHFLAVYARARGLRFEGFSPEAKALLLRYDFPGNVRELRNLVERAAILRRSGQVLPEHLNLSKLPVSSLPAPSDDHPERAFIVSALDAARWNRRQAAKNLGIPYSTLRYKMQKLGIG